MNKSGLEFEVCGVQCKGIKGESQCIQSKVCENL